ncbi:putative dimethylaniline monooxygenase [Neofusicoccum parvum]|uniref:Dimethylaniline monooxygenase n=1 Tax=Neofusicoccum parvum TaxID=310453 RepID=A0ACB5S3T2_9PEZI|nr:putative dimethylaniline monooxygenase [Neofusicoccum parvum]
MSLDTEVLIIGGGPSGLGMAIQLIRKLGTRNFTILEKSDDIGGTWYANSYPGCGCDVPSHFYSFSFALNPNWSQTYALQPEIRQYLVDLAAQYRLPQHIRLNTAVEEATWDADTGTWLVTARNQTTKETSQLRCKILVSAVGSLSVPKECDIPGAETFTGRIFHSARWDHSFDPTNKNIVVIGNGCSATQFVPILSAPGPSAAAHITQFSRQPHWLAPRPNPPYSPAFRALMRWCPLAMRLYRLSLFLAAESGFAAFATTSGAAARARDTAAQTAYIRANAPPPHAAALVPTTVLGCKRKVMDTDYLASLHRPHVTLIATDPVARLTPTGVATASGAHVPADAVVLATGFQTQAPLAPMRVRGEGGVRVEEHWREVNAGSPAAYHGTLLAGFPNFFVLMGPNTRIWGLLVNFQLLSMHCLKKQD